MEQINNEIINIDVSNNLISLWEENDKSKYSELIKELMISDDLITFLSRYLKDRWIVDSIDNIELLSDNKFEISYNKSLYNGCRDLDLHDDDYLEVNFIMKLESFEVQIIGQPIPEERSTFEEF
ncbi:hypothetical protein [Empedobacter brevis]|uniref:hypothetical protein n=1 Tax=Empedobacter brevis TaxID=247 RepID=UPI003340B31A